jgi:KUP system potassium uptake protein
VLFCASRYRKLVSLKQHNGPTVLKRAPIHPARDLGALGVVFGDIGTSPLYAAGLLFAAIGSEPSRADVLGGISLIIWILTIIVAVKYALLILKADNDGEGGVFALYGLLYKSARQRKSWFSTILLLGAGLLFGDALITPAISVLSAVEGLTVAEPKLSAFVVPVTLTILIALFSLQQRGSAAIGRLFGPIMLVWFITLAVLGLLQIIREPSILLALSPYHALAMLMRGDLTINLALLGAVILVVTGSEAMYDDLGHFGKRPIRRAWFALVFPALVLCYLGQGALLLSAPNLASSGLLFRIVPDSILLPFIILATAATVIASQALISGVFSQTSQAVALGFFPPIQIRHTREGHYGEVYVPFVNWMLLAGCIATVLIFGSSEALGAAYGLAVAGDMLITSIATLLIASKVWRWGRLRLLSVFLPLAGLDMSFVIANSLKVLEGGFIPLLVGFTVFCIMLLWTWGRSQTLLAYRRQPRMRMADIIERHRKTDQYIEQTAVLMVADDSFSKKTWHAPALLQLLVDRKGSLPRNIVLMHVEHQKIPYTGDGHIEAHVLEENDRGRIIRIVMRFGFMEIPNVERGLQLLAALPQVGLETGHRAWNVLVAREHLAPAPNMALHRYCRFKVYELLRLTSQPAYYRYSLGYTVPLSVEILPVHFS